MSVLSSGFFTGWFTEGLPLSGALNNYVYVESKEMRAEYEGLEISTKALYLHFMRAMMAKATLVLRVYVS